MQLLLPLLNSAAATWFSFVYHITWQASLLAVLVLAVVLLRRRWPSPLRYWLLVLALAKFAPATALSMPTGLFSHVGPAVECRTDRGELPHSRAGRILPSWIRPRRWGSIPVGLGSEINPYRNGRSPWQNLTTSAPVLDGKSWLMLLHISGAMVAACWILRSLLAMRRTLRRTTEVTDGELQRRFVRLSEQLGLRRLPRLLLSHEPCGPAAFGVLRPVVVLPDDGGLAGGFGAGRYPGA